MMRRKKQAVVSLGQKILKTSAGKEQDHALRTLSLISGRSYHHEPKGKGIENARAWLKRHKQ
jgi:hypothetical protein